MGFGLRNAAQTFQRTVDQKCRDLKFLFTYLEDSRLGSKTAAEHLAHLDHFFAVLAANGMVVIISPDKLAGYSSHPVRNSIWKP
jgi:hypothetical protein